MLRLSQYRTGELLGFIAWPIVASIISLSFPFSPFVSLFVFYGPPCVYLCFKNPKHVPKAGIFAMIIGAPFMFIFDYIAHLTGAWHLNNTLPRILTYVAIEDVIFLVVWMFFLIMFYENFLKHSVNERLWTPRMKYAVVFMIILLVSFMLLITNFPRVLNIPYFYLIIGCVAGLIPIVIEIFKYPRIFLTFLGTGLYFFYFHLIHELIGLKLGWWSFPGTQFIGHITLFDLTFPFEEFLFWITLGSFTFLSYFRLLGTTQNNEK